jgi:two-component sensor histidine kinase
MYKNFLFLCFAILSMRDARERTLEKVNDFDVVKLKQISDMQTNNQLHQNEDSIRMLRGQAKLEAQRVKLSLDIAFFSLAMLLVLTGIVYYGYRSKRLSNFELRFQQTQINKQNRQLQALALEKDKLISDKDWLLKEIHHRVKNNLQIVISLLNTQAAYLKDNAAFEAISDSQNRVHTISLIHQKLYSTGRVSAIPMDVYINDLVQYLSDCFNTAKKGIRFEQDIEPFELEIAQAIPVGLILNETITNAIKYAFDGSDGRIFIGLRLIKGNEVLLTLADSGKGLVEGFDIEVATTLGMEMIKALCKQLDGKFSVENKGGAAISVIFKLEKAVDGPAANDLIT